MSIININSPTNNLQRQMANIQFINITSDYRRVRVSKNTDKACEGKLEEFLQYCDVLYPDDSNPRLVIVEKVFYFLYYCAYQKKKKTYIQKNVLSNGHVVRFTLSNYVHVNNADHNGLCENENVIAFSQ